jgi:hypothetical protein
VKGRDTRRAILISSLKGDQITFYSELKTNKNARRKLKKNFALKYERRKYYKSVLCFLKNTIYIYTVYVYIVRAAERQTCT